MEETGRWSTSLGLAYGNTNLVATGEAVLDNQYTLSPVKIVKSTKADKEEKPWIFVLPNVRRTRNGQAEWEGAFEFASQEAREEFEKAMLKGLREALIKSNDPEFERESNLSINVKMVDYKSIRGTATIQYEDALRIKNVNIMEGKNGPFISYPKTEEPPDKEKAELLSTLRQVKERLAVISDSSELQGTDRQEIDSLRQYVEQQESRLGKTKYRDIISPKNYLFGSYVEDAVLAEYSKAKSKDHSQKNNMDEKRKKATNKQL